MFRSVALEYELIYLGAMLLLAAIERAVVAALRLLLRRWDAPFAKAFCTHAAGIAVCLALPSAVWFGPLGFAGLSRLTVIVFGVLMMAADATRDRLRKIDPARTTSKPWLAWSAIALVAVAVPRLTAHADSSRAALLQVAMDRSVLSSLRQGHTGAAIAALERDFPAESPRILAAASARARAASDYGRKPLVIEFPRRETNALIRDNRAALARAPDVELARVAEQLQWFAGILETLPRNCAALSVAELPIVESGADAPLSVEEERRFAAMIATVLDAARAGIDRPVDRDFDDARAAQYAAEFFGSLPTDLRAVAVDPARLREASEGGRCVIWAGYLRWLGTAREEVAAFMLAYHFAKSPDSSSR